MDEKNKKKKNYPSSHSIIVRGVPYDLVTSSSRRISVTRNSLQFTIRDAALTLRMRDTSCTGLSFYTQ